MCTHPTVDFLYPYIKNRKFKYSNSVVEKLNNKILTRIIFSIISMNFNVVLNLCQKLSGY